MDFGKKMFPEIDLFDFTRFLVWTFKNFLALSCYFVNVFPVLFLVKALILKLSNCFSEASDEFKDEKEDMIIKSENNSIAWSSEDDVPPQIIIQNKSSKKLEPLLQPLKYKSPTKE